MSVPSLTAEALAELRTRQRTLGDAGLVLLLEEERDRLSARVAEAVADEKRDAARIAELEADIEMDTAGMMRRCEALRGEILIANRRGDLARAALQRIAELATTSPLADALAIAQAALTPPSPVIVCGGCGGSVRAEQGRSYRTVCGPGVMTDCPELLP